MKNDNFGEENVIERDLVSFEKYLKYIFRDLSKDKENITKSAFIGYINTDKDGNLSKGEFKEGIAILVTGDYKDVIDLYFKICDFDHDGKVYFSDIKLILSFILKAGSKEWAKVVTIFDSVDLTRDLSLVDFSAFFDVHPELNLYLYEYFYLNLPISQASIENLDSKNTINGDDLIRTTSITPINSPILNARKRSDYDFKRVSLDKLEMHIKSHNNSQNNSNEIRNNLISEILESEGENVESEYLDGKNPEIVLPFLLKRQKLEELNQNLNEDWVDDAKQGCSNYELEINQDILTAKKSNYEVSDEKKEFFKDNLESVQEKNIERFVIINVNTPLIFYTEEKSNLTRPRLSTFSHKLNLNKQYFTKLSEKIGEEELNDKIKLELNSSDTNKSNDTQSNSQNNNDSSNHPIKIPNLSFTLNNSFSDYLFVGFIYKLTSKGKMRKYWISFIQKDMYYFNHSKEKFEGLHNISEAYAEYGKKEEIEDKYYYSFSYIIRNKRKTYYCETPEECMMFVDLLRKITNYRDINDYYSLHEVVGKGQFGVVRTGTEKKTQAMVAIKVIDKTKLNDEERLLFNGEIEIMKRCNCDNIDDDYQSDPRSRYVAKFYDHFETHDNIFIVMEHLQGGSLANMLKRQKNVLSEEYVKSVMKQIVEGLTYLRELSIIHRDLKPENIMLDRESQVKIVDFGLSRVIGHNQFIFEEYGTINYVAPEIILNTGYNMGVDIWSLGVILYYFLSGKLPFDDYNKCPRKIAQNIINKTIQYPSSTWSAISEEALDLVKKCLTDEDTRIDVDSFQNHPWFGK